MGKYPITAAALGIALAAQPLTEAAASVYAARELIWAKFASPSSFSMGLPTTAIGKGTGRVGHPGRAHIPAGAANLVGEERLPGGPSGLERSAVLVWPTMGATAVLRHDLCGCRARHFAYRCCRRLRPYRPHPDLCWYWADPYGETGYWDYC